MIGELGMLVVAAVGAGLLAWIFSVAARSPFAAVVMLLVVFVVTQGVRDRYNYSFSVGPVQFYALDVFAGVFVTIAIFRVLTRDVGRFSSGLALALLFLYAVHVTRGILDFGLQTGVSQSRDVLFFIAPLAYVATSPKALDVRIWRAVAVAGTALTVVAAFYMSSEGFRAVNDPIVVAGVRTDPRPVIAASTLIILQSAVLYLVLQWPTPRASRWLAALSIAGIVAMQHRTVWVAGAAAFAVGFAQWSRRTMPRNQPLVFGATGVLILALPAALWGFLHTRALTTSAEVATSKNSTLLWRISGWKDLVGQHHTLSEVVFGEPSGASWARVIGKGVTDVSPHNFFVELFLRFGLPGVVALAVLLFILWSQRELYADVTGLTTTCITMLLIAQFAFCMTYGLDLVQGLMLGVLVRAHVSTPVPVATASSVHRVPVVAS